MKCTMVFKAPALLLYVRVRWCPLSGISLLFGCPLLTEFGGVRLTVVMTFPERTDVVLGRSRSDFGSALLVARRMPLRDGVKDNLGREQSHLSKVRIANCLTFNSLPLRLQIAFRLLQLSDQSVDFCNRRGSDFLNERRDHLRVSFCLRGKLRIGEIANFSSNRQICG